MNTALNFVSMPKDSASSALSGDLSPDKSAHMAIDSADKRQDLAGREENNSSFANVLKEESNQGPGQIQKGTEDRDEQSAKSDSTDNKAVDAESADTHAANTIEDDGPNSAADNRAIEEPAREANSEGDIILSELKTQVQTTPQVSTASSLNLSGPVTETSASKIHGSDPAIAKEATDQINETTAQTLASSTKSPGTNSSEVSLETQLASSDEAPVHSTDSRVDTKKSASAVQPTSSGNTTNDTALYNVSASVSAKINSNNTPTVAESALKAGTLQHPPLVTTVQASTSGSTQPAAQVSSSEETQPVRPVALTAEQLQAKAAVQQNSNEIVKQAAIGTQPAAQGEEALAAAASSELKESQIKSKPIPVSASLESLPVTSSELNESQTKSNSISVSASLESLPAAGKPLPNSGKNLPAGLFFQGEGESPVISRGEQATQPIDLNSAIAAKANSTAQPNLDKGMEITGDKFIRNLLSAANTTTEATAPVASAPLSTDNAANTPPLLNPLLQVTTDKSLQAARPPLAGGAESALNLNITSQAGSAEWQSQLSSRIRWMGSLKLSSAELKLHPAELGAMEIKISTEDDQTRISFITNNAAAKEVIESTLPRLREMLGEGGLHLEQGDVAQRDLSEDKQAHGALNGNQKDNEDGEEAELQQANLHIKRNSTSQIDHYV